MYIYACIQLGQTEKRGSAGLTSSACPAVIMMPILIILLLFASTANQGEANDAHFRRKQLLPVIQMWPCKYLTGPATLQRQAVR